LDAHVRAIVLTGSGATFCVGGDVSAMAAAENRRTFLYGLAMEAHRAVLALATLRKPVVVAVNGAAAGAGLALTLQGDAVIAGESSLFVPAYLAVGLTPDCGLSWLLPEIIGLRPALGLLLNNRRVGALEGLELGLAGEIVPDDAVLARAQGLAREWAGAPHPALGNARWLVRRAVAQGLRRHLEVEAGTIAAASGTPDSVKRIDAFLRARSDQPVSSD
jgi:2-(1,2-epoxy-1,2-dihydrophenyl)acetyl-CoA isomerase